MNSDVFQCLSNHFEFIYFTEEIIGPGGYTPLPVLPVRIVGDHDNNGGGDPWILFDVLKQIDAASAGQPYIQDNYIRV